MIKKVIQVRGLGLLHDTGVSPPFAESTLLFAENGRGKSTLSALLASLRSGDTKALERLNTIDQSLPIEATLLFEGAPNQSVLSWPTWDHLRPEIAVFDSQFVKDNVYTGTDVEIDQRRNLLSFVLGDSAVAESSRERDATEKASKLRARIRSAEAQLAPALHGYSIDAFIALPQDSSLAERASMADKKIHNQERAELLLAQPSPSKVGLVDPDISGTMNALKTSLVEMGDESEKRVRDHFASSHRSGVEEWAKEGLQFSDAHDCPFCGQDIRQVDLIDAYREFFSAEYEAHVRAIGLAAESFEALTGAAHVQALSREIADQRVLTATWSLVVDGLAPVPDSEVDLVSLFADLNRVVSAAFTEKRAAPLTAINPATLSSQAEALWEAIQDHVGGLNNALEIATNSIDAFKAGLQDESVEALRAKRGLLEAERLRYTPEVAKLVDGILQDRLDASAAERDQQASRNNVRQLMNDTLDKYQVRINELLGRFGAGFAIQSMKMSFRGAAPQTEFAILLRSRPVPLKADRGPHFDTALSDGDKRTLAFAFFAASAGDMPTLGSSILVIDDPMSSMDTARRAMTIEVLLDLNVKCSQLILSSHDQHFLRDYRKALNKRDKSKLVAELRLVAAADDYSKWEAASLDKLSESDSARNRREIHQFVESNTGDAAVIVRNLRPALEGYLRERFPNHLMGGPMLGDCIKAIRDADAMNPLAYAKPLVDDLAKINSYAGQFHHPSPPAINATEVKSYAIRVMDVLLGKPIP